MHIHVLSQVAPQCPCTEGASNPLLLLGLLAATWVVILGLQSFFAKRGKKTMNKTAKITIVVLLVAAVVGVIAIKRSQSEQAGGKEVPEQYRPGRLVGQGVPALVDLGAGKCTACKMMMPVLEELGEQFAGAMAVHVLDVAQYPGLVDMYKVELIPTQIFYDASGKELARHTGFISREKILDKWSELGIDLQAVQ